MQPNRHTVQPTAAVSETHIGRMGGEKPSFRDRAHLFAKASVVIRTALVDYARQGAAGKHLDGKQKSELRDFLAARGPGLDQTLMMDEALLQPQSSGPAT